jgi:hypothetical protein
MVTVGEALLFSYIVILYRKGNWAKLALKNKVICQLFCFFLEMAFDKLHNPNFLINWQSL